MKVFNHLKLSELQDTLLKIIKNDNHECSSIDKKEYNLKYLTIKSILLERSLISRNSLINIYIDCIEILFMKNKKYKK